MYQDQPVYGISGHHIEVISIRYIARKSCRAIHLCIRLPLVTLLATKKKPRDH